MSRDHLDAAIAGPLYLEGLCRQAIPDADLRWTLSDLEGHSILGQPPPARQVVVRSAASAKLPWTLHVFAPPEIGLGSPSPRQRLLISVFAVLAIVLFTGAYFTLRAISSELHVARLQSDFVAAVSHEFRSPLTSLRQISEMLSRDRIPSEDLRRKSYEVLERETERLHRLVEGLLDFGRFEAGAATYRFEVIEIGAFIRAIITGFQESVGPNGFKVELYALTGETYVRADREALSRALWNLLDNAVKYSPTCRTVWVEVERVHNRISIAVRDCGLGIPMHEQREIFNRFVRGADSKALHIKGTGIGLAMVRHIVRAHGGEILLASEPGQGSRFTVVLHAAGGLR
jgi:signal transduction histidine kinase